MTSETNRRAFLAALAASGASIAGANRLFASDATPDPHEHEHDHDDAHDHDDHSDDHDHDDHGDGDAYLLVGDTEAKTLTVYSTPDYSEIEVLEDVVVNSHAGTIPLADGSILLVDDEGSRLLHIEVHGDHLHVHEAPITGHVAHIAVDSDHAHYCAVGTSGEDEHQLFLVDLESWEVTALELPDAAEVGLMMTHDHFFHRNSNLNRLEAYGVSDLLAGNVDLLSYVDIGTFGHGEAINEETGELFMLTDDGVDIAYWEGEELTYGKTLAWPDADTPARGYFCRLINDGRHLLTYTSDRSAPETEWNTWKNRVVIYDIASGEATTTDLPDGYTFRYSLSDEIAIFTVISADGDQVISIDIDPEHETFGGVLATTPLVSMSGGAGVGDAFYEVGAYRSAAILPDASAAFISQGGDGIVEVIDPVQGESISKIEHAGPLTGGGTLAVFGTAVPFTDTIGR